MATNPGNARLQPGQCGLGIWTFRGYLPHFDSPNRVQHVTFHLADSLPATVLDRLKLELDALPIERRDAEHRRRVQAWLDAGHGSCLLRNPEAARLVQDALLHFDKQRYDLFAWVIMPNHIHALFQTMPEWPLTKIVASWKSYTGRRLAPLFPPRADDAVTNFRVWHREHWDRYIRNERHFGAAVNYIHENPVKAGLAATPEDWPWSSATPGNARLQPGSYQSPHSPLPHSGATAPRHAGKDNAARLEPGVPRKEGTGHGE